MLGGHTHVVRSSQRKKRVRECRRRLLHSFATNLRRIENPPWRSASGETSKCSIELVEEQ